MIDQTVRRHHARLARLFFSAIHLTRTKVIYTDLALFYLPLHRPCQSSLVFDPFIAPMPEPFPVVALRLERYAYHGNRTHLTMILNYHPSEDVCVIQVQDGQPHVWLFRYADHMGRVVAMPASSRTDADSRSIRGGVTHRNVLTVREGHRCR